MFVPAFILHLLEEESDPKFGENIDVEEAESATKVEAV